MGKERIWPRGWRAIVLLLVGSLMGANLLSPAVAHVGGTVSHLWGHLKPKVKTYGDGRWAKKPTSSRLGFTDTTEISSLLSSDGEQVVASVTVTVPGTLNQIVEVTGNFMVWDFNNTECPCEVDYYLAEQGGPSNLNNVAFVFVLDGSAGGGPGTSTTRFTAAPGTHTYELRARSFDNPTDSVNVAYARMTAQTVPFSESGGVPSILSPTSSSKSASGPASRS